MFGAQFDLIVSAVHSDQLLRQAVVAEFKTSPNFHYAQLSVIVEDGSVTITGKVNTLAERNAVEQAAKRVPGIKTLILEIHAAAIRSNVWHTGHRCDPQ